MLIYFGGIKMNSAEKLKNILYSKGIKHLYHANTVTTASTFLELGGLLSRQQVEEQGLKQTKQYTDRDDKKYGIWNDIFFDFVDIHDRACNYNQYGPILFVFNVDVLSQCESEILITKKNPTKWHLCNEDDYYFKDVSEFDKNYVYGNFDNMLTIHNVQGILPFNKYLEKIIIDNPYCKWNGKDDVFEYIINSFIKIGRKRNLNINRLLEERHCGCGCRCFDEYINMDDKKFQHYFDFNAK